MEIFAAPVISVLLGSVTNLLGERVQLILHAKDNLKELKGKLERLQKALEDVDRKPFFSNQHERDRVGEVKDVLYDAQDIIEKYRTKIELKKRRKHSILPNKVHVCFFSYWLGKKIKEVNQRLNQIKATTEMEKLTFDETTPKEDGEGRDNPRETTQHIGSPTPIGRVDDKEKVKKELLHCSMENGVSIISIVGQGGIGKTTLAKMVFDEVEEQFGEHMWWVCVSERPKKEGLLRKILKEMLPMESERDLGAITSLSLNGLCTRSRSELSKERFLLVLDDVWELDWWHGEVKGALMSGKMGSKILITTRNEDVSKGMKASYMHKLPQLTFDESWALFLEMAEKEENELENHNLKDIATNIVKKCGGLPLVVQTVGSLMCTKKMKKEDWETVEKSPIWKWKLPASSSSCEYGGILPGLILSYDDLPLSLKTCFVYCSIFPKDYVIKREKLIMQWVAHELIEENKDIDVEVTANQYMEDLTSRYLIEKTEKGDLKLHDILHDLASYIGGKEYSHDFAIEHTRHLSLPSAVVEAMPSASLGKNKLRTLLSTHESYFQSPIVADLTNFKWLRVLSMEYCKIHELPQSIGDLSLLKYLDLSHTCVRKLPTSIGRLCNLQTMNLNDSSIKELPKEMGELCNLRYLGLECTWYLEFIAEGLGKLSNLQTLKRFFICDDRENARGCNMRELRGLNKLKGELSIEGLGGSRKAIHHAEEAPQLLKEKCGLISLKLVFKKDDNVASASEQSGMLEALEPPHGLKELEIYNYKGQMPAWFLQPNYAMLQTLELEDCPFWVKVIRINSLERLRVKECPTLCEIASMPLLKFLDVWCCDGLNTIGHMPKLESLEVNSCDMLKQVVDMPALKSLKVDGCNSVEQLSDLSALKWLIVQCSTGLRTLTKMPALESLEVFGCGMLKQVVDTPALESLRVYSCHGLEQVADLSALNSLVVKYSNGLKTLPNMPVLKQLKVSQCGSLEQIADLSALISLVVKYSDGLKTLANMPALESLEVRGCDGIEQVADLSALKSLVVRCSNGLKTLANMPALESLEVDECDGLELVADMPALKVLRLFNLNTLKLSACQTQLQQLTVLYCPSARLEWGLLKQLPNLIKLKLDKVALDSALPSPLPSEVSTFLPSLKSLTLSDSNDGWGRVPEWVWGLSQLEELELWKFDEQISLGGHWQCLQKLRRLRLFQFPSLKSLVDINIIPKQNNAVAIPPATDANQQVACLSSLEYLDIEDCPTLDLPQELRNRRKG